MIDKNLQALFHETPHGVGFSKRFLKTCKSTDAFVVFYEYERILFSFSKSQLYLLFSAVQLTELLLSRFFSRKSYFFQSRYCAFTCTEFSCYSVAISTRFKALNNLNPTIMTLIFLRFSASYNCRKPKYTAKISDLIIPHVKCYFAYHSYYYLWKWCMTSTSSLLIYLTKFSI